MINKSSLLFLSFSFSLFFLLFYFEAISMGGIKFSFLWKLPLIIFLGIYFFKFNKDTWLLPSFVFFGLLLSFKIFVSLSSLIYIMTTITEFIKLIVFFLLFFYFNNKYTREYLIYMGTLLSIFIIISFLPFMLGFLDSLGKTIDMSKFGNIIGSSLVGVFQNPHAAGITLSFSMLVIYFNFYNETNNKLKLFFLGLLFLGLIALSMTMVRTSLAMFFVGAFYISYKRFNFKHYLLMIISILLIGLYLASVYDKSVLLQSMVVRLQGDTKYTNFDEVGSGRVKFASIAIDSWQSEGIPSIVIGLGMELGKNKMGDAFGTRLVAHNGFVQVLQSEGLVGFILLLLFLYYLFIYIVRYRQDKLFPLLFSMYLAYLIFYYVQGGNYFLLYVLFAIYLAALSKAELTIFDGEEKKLKENIYEK